MFGKLSPRILLVVVAALALIYALSNMFSLRSKERSFKEYVLQLDTSAVTSVSFTPRKMKGKEIRLDRSGVDWTVTSDEKTHPGDPQSIRTMLGNFVALRSQRLVGAKDAVEDREELNDSLAVPISFTLRDGTKHELLIGKSAYSEAGQPVTYVNVPGESEVYAVGSLLLNQLDQPLSNWRPRALVKGDPASWQRLTFSFPGDSSYVLERNGSAWLVDSVPGDSSKIENFLKSLARSQAHDVADSVDVTTLQPTYRLVIQDRSRPEGIQVLAYPWQQGYVATSTINPGSVLSFDPMRELPRMFRPRTAGCPRHRSRLPSLLVDLRRLCGRVGGLSG
jgi:hypothetical protein